MDIQNLPPIVDKNNDRVNLNSIRDAEHARKSEGTFEINRAILNLKSQLSKVDQQLKEFPDEMLLSSSRRTLKETVEKSDLLMLQALRDTLRLKQLDLEITKLRKNHFKSLEPNSDTKSHSVSQNKLNEKLEPLINEKRTIESRLKHDPWATGCIDRFVDNKEWNNIELKYLNLSDLTSYRRPFHSETQHIVDQPYLILSEAGVYNLSSISLLKEPIRSMGKIAKESTELLIKNW